MHQSEEKISGITHWGIRARYPNFLTIPTLEKEGRNLEKWLREMSRDFDSTIVSLIQDYATRAAGKVSSAARQPEKPVMPNTEANPAQTCNEMNLEFLPNKYVYNEPELQ